MLGKGKTIALRQATMQHWCPMYIGDKAGILVFKDPTRVLQHFILKCYIYSWQWISF